VLKKPSPSVAVSDGPNTYQRRQFIRTLKAVSPSKSARNDSSAACFCAAASTSKNSFLLPRGRKMRGFRVSIRNFSTSSVWEAGRKAREAARALAALPNEDRNAALERVAAALETGKVNNTYDASLPASDLGCRVLSKRRISSIVMKQRSLLRAWRHLCRQG
jgi:hypothetical protein